MAAEKYFPFRSVSGDRKYSAEDWAAYFALFLSDGVCYSSADRLKVVVNEGMKVKVMPGAGFIAGRMYMLETDKVITLDTADGALNRIDRIVLRCDYTNRRMGVEVVKGSYSENPTAPAITRGADVYELALADVYVAAGVISVTQSNISDQRLNTSLCGIVTGLIEQADTTEIFNQFTAYLEDFKQTSGEDFNAQINEWDTEFNAWFDEIKEALEGDVATELAAKIVALENGTTPVGDSEKLGGKGASKYLNKTSIGAIGQAYRVFARMDATLNNEPETILISGGGGFSNEDGLWAVCFYARPSSNQAFIIRELIPPKTGEVKFGWYTDGNYRYFGMYTSYPYSSVPFIVKLDGKSEDGTYNAEYGEFYTSATMPTGWAEVPTNKFATDADLANYALISQLFSKVKDYANLNFDTALTTSIFTSTAPPNNVGATNYPVNATGILVVFSNGGSSVTQQYFTYTGELWRRSYFTGIGWTKWDRDTTTADLAHYLPLNGGGTVSNPNGVPIVFRGATNYALAQYQKADGSYLGYLGFEGEDNLVAYMSDGATNYKVLHSGNVDEYTAGSAERLNGRESAEPLTTDYGKGSVKYRFAMSPTQFEKFFPAIDNSNALLQLNRHDGGYISQLGFSSDHNIYYRASLSAAWRKILDSNNIAEHALPISGGTVSKADGIPFGVESTSDHEATLIDFRKKGSRVGLIGVDKNGVPKFVDINSAWHTLHHDGNSAKVVLSETPLTAEGSIRVW